MILNLKNRLGPILTQAFKACDMNSQVTSQTNLIHTNPIKISYLVQKPQYEFSNYFKQLDETDVQTYSQRKYQNKKFRGLIDLWKKPLQRKRRRQQRIKQIQQTLPQPKPEEQKLIVHNSAVGIQYPPQKNQIFCVIKVDSTQFKVTEDCVLILDTKQDHEINKPNVLLAATSSYTVLGRPTVKNTYVEGIIESISESEKTLVFKKKRRKQYKKSFGSRVKLTSCRITRIVHELTPQTLSKAVSLTQPSANVQSQALP